MKPYSLDLREKIIDDYKLPNAVTGKHLNSIQVNLSPFDRGSKVSVIGAITVSKVLAVMTLDDSIDAAAFKVYVSKCLVPQLWKGAVVVMDNLPAHKVKASAPLIEEWERKFCTYLLTPQSLIRLNIGGLS